MKTKKYFLSLLLATMMCAPFTASAQVTIGSAEPPQATLDIRGAEGETGQAFRLIDGNHDVPGRVLTVGEDGIGTWLPSAITVHSTTLTNRVPGTADTQTFRFQDFVAVNVNYVDSLNYVYLDPGLYMVFMQVPIMLDFALQPFERFRYNVGFIRAGSTTRAFHRLTDIHGPLNANVPTRQMQMGIFDTRSDTGRTRYYVTYHGLQFWNAEGAPNNSAIVARNGQATINVATIALSIFLVPMNQ